MNKLTSLVVLSLLALSCGDNKTVPVDASKDAPENVAPALGAQIDRLGRPAINTAMNAVLEPVAANKAAQKDAYNVASDPATWATTEVKAGVTVVQEFAAHAALFDIIDKGLAGVANSGCGNSALYSPPASPTSYTMLASVLADDQLYVDTTKTSCLLYLSLEVEVATGGGVTHTQCGGRTLSQDVGDVSYSLLGAGVNGFDPTMNFKPKITDGAVKHADVDDTTFPFLGAPH
jgi:hypothetical protein